MLAASDSGRREDALAQIAARDWQAVEHDDPYAAMQELCVREQAAAARAAWGIDRTERPALLVVEPQRWAQLDQLLDAVTRHVPAAAVWALDEQGLRQIAAPAAPLAAGGSAAQAQTPGPTSGPPPGPPASTRRGAPQLRLAGVEEGVERTDEDEAGRDEAPAPPELSAEEIRMLLGKEPREGTS